MWQDTYQVGENPAWFISLSRRPDWVNVRWPTTNRYECETCKRRLPRGRLPVRVTISLLLARVQREGAKRRRRRAGGVGRNRCGWAARCGRRAAPTEWTRG